MDYKAAVQCYSFLNINALLPQQNTEKSTNFLAESVDILVCLVFWPPRLCTLNLFLSQLI